MKMNFFIIYLEVIQEKDIIASKNIRLNRIYNLQLIQECLHYKKMGCKSKWNFIGFFRLNCM